MMETGVAGLNAMFNASISMSKKSSSLEVIELENEVGDDDSGSVWLVYKKYEHVGGGEKWETWSGSRS